MKFIHYIILSSLIFSQNIDVNENLFPDDIIETEYFEITEKSEVVAFLNMSTNTNWSQSGSESATLTIYINSFDSTGYSQDIVLYNGGQIFEYPILIGELEEGTHSLFLKFNFNKSTPGAEFIYIDTINFESYNRNNSMYNIMKYSPMMYGRNIFAWNESTYTDIPLVMFYDTNLAENSSGLLTQNITYSVIFSNEDSRIGLGLSDMMLSWGRTTDIEWMYTVSLTLSDSVGNILDEPQINNEYFQAASHITTIFNGSKFQETHPFLINATANCNFSDNGTSDYRFFLPPLLTPDQNHTREYIMDQNPWTYKIMGQELENEDKYEGISNPNTYQMSDIRNYLYIEYNGLSNNEIIELQVAAQILDECDNYFYNDHDIPNMTSLFSGNVTRTAIELINGYSPELISTLYFIPNCNSCSGIIDYIDCFYLNENFEKINIDVIWNDLELIEFSSEIPASIPLQNIDLQTLGCGGIDNPDFFCDPCNECVELENPECTLACDGNFYNDNTQPIVDECGICGGLNLNQDDCGVCFGTNESCSGCTDQNAINFDQNATVDNGSCEYENSDNTLIVPIEFSTIQIAIQAAETGNEILVYPGEYHENINLLGKNITIKSLEGPEQTYILGDSTTSVVICNSEESNQTIIEGFTISGGYGIGVSFEDFVSNAANPDIFEDMVINQMMGGGISCINSSPTLKNLIVSGNYARNVAGGIGLVNSNSLLENIIVENNTIIDGDALGGGGVALNGGNATIRNSTISNNYVGLNFYQVNGGGGILCGFTFDGSMSMNIDDVIIQNNIANIGAGVGVLSGEILINRTLITGNIGEFGSVLSLGEPLGLVVNNIDATIINSTLTDNQGSISIGMIDSSELKLLNTILWNEGSLQIANLPNNNTLNAEIHYCSIYNGWDGLNNSSSNPLFENNFYQLSSTSPLIDAGISYFIFNDDYEISIDASQYNGDSPDIGYHEYSIDIFELGDLNTDQTLDILDLLVLVNIIIENINATEQQLVLSDINIDNTIDILDVMLLVNLILEIQ